jgi:hypothetical protein
VTSRPIPTRRAAAAAAMPSAESEPVAGSVPAPERRAVEVATTATVGDVVDVAVEVGEDVGIAVEGDVDDGDGDMVVDVVFEVSSLDEPDL